MHTTFTAPDDRLAAELAGDFHHIVTLTTLAGFDITACPEIMAASYRQSRFAGSHEYRFRLSGMSPGEARRLANRFSTLPGVTGIQVEHMIGRPCR